MEDGVETRTKHRGVERRNLNTFMIGCAMLGVVCAVGYKIGMVVVKKAAAFWMQ